MSEDMLDDVYLQLAPRQDEPSQYQFHFPDGSFRIASMQEIILWEILKCQRLILTDMAEDF